MEVARIETFIKATCSRIAKVSARALRERWHGRVKQELARTLWSLFGRAPVTDWLARTIRAELIARDQVRELGSEAQRDSPEWAEAEVRRQVLAALMAPGPTFRPVPGLAAVTGLGAADVERALQKKAEHPLFEIWRGPRRDDHDTYALRRYSPHPKTIARLEPSLRVGLRQLGP